MTSAEIDELDRLIAAYRAARHPSTKMRTRRDLETALVRNAETLLAAVKAQKPCGVSYPEIEPAPPMAAVRAR